MNGWVMLAFIGLRIAYVEGGSGGGPTRGNPYSLGERLYRGYREESYPFLKAM